MANPPVPRPPIIHITSDRDPRLVKARAQHGAQSVVEQAISTRSCGLCGFVVDGGGLLEAVVCLQCLYRTYNPLSAGFVRDAWRYAEQIEGAAPAYLPFPHLRIEVVLCAPEHQTRYLDATYRPYQATDETTCALCGTHLKAAQPLLLRLAALDTPNTP